jgi:hypothetical protein
MKPVGKPDAGNRHVRFDERGRETGGASASVLAPVLDSTKCLGATTWRRHSPETLRPPLGFAPGESACATSAGGL